MLLLTGTFSAHQLLIAVLLAAAAGFLCCMLVQKIRAKRHSLRSARQIGAVTLLPKPAVCCNGALSFSMPLDFHMEKQANGNAVFVGSGDVRLTVMQLPLSSVRIRTLTGSELQRYFCEAIPMHSTPQVSYGYLDHSPTLTAWWRSEPVGTLACMHLIQVRDAVFLMQFTGIRLEAHRFVEPMLASVSVRKETI